MDRMHVRPSVHRVLTHALPFGAALIGIALVELVATTTGQFVTAILVLPVGAAAWYGGLRAATITIALQAVLTFVLLPPAFHFTVAAPAEIIRLIAATGVSFLAALGTVRVRRIERRFRAVVTVASEGIWTIDADGRTTYVNPRMADMLGYTPAELQRRRFSEFVPPAAVPTAEAGFQQRKSGVPERNECELVRKDGSTLWVHYAGTPLSDGIRFIGGLAVVTDISERKRDEAIIRRQTEALEGANRQKEDFLAMLGHELRNPLAPLVTAVKLMELKSDGSFQRERAVIARQVEQISRLVDDISDVSRFMRGKLLMHSGIVNVAQLVREACEAVSPLMMRKQHALDVQVPGDLVVQGDRLRLRQVLVNLLTNAAKYTPSGRRVVVSAEGDHDHVVIRVRDDGVGIAPDFLLLLFEPFAQKPETIDHSEGGLGLGLPIVRNIVQAHGGTVTAHSDGEGRGSEFVVRLPIVMPAPAFPNEAACDVTAPL